jgi:anthranilate phosphoribosyltransferase
MDEISNLGPTIFCRLNERGHLEKFILEPEELGVKRAKAEELAPAGSPDKEAVGLVRFLAGQANGARQDAVCLNTAPMFILARRVEDFKAGVELARELIFSGKGLVKLEEWVSCQNRESQVGQARFESVLKKAGVSS